MKKLLAAIVVALLMADSMVIAEGQKIETVGVFSDTVNGKGVIFTDGSDQKRYFAIKEVVQKLGDLKGKPVRVSAKVNLNPKDNAMVMVYLSSVMPYIAENTDGKIDLDDPETRKQIIAEAIDLEKLENRGQKGEELFYASNEQTPYTGWTKYWRHGYVGTERLSQFKDGKREGLWTFMHNNGRKRSEGIYKDGKKDGLWTSWHVNGLKQSEGIYKDGKKDGLWTSWQNDGKEDGIFTSWYKNGQIKRGQSTWKDAEPKTPFYFHPVFWFLIATLLLVGAVYPILRVKKSRQKELTPEETESRVLEDEPSAPFPETQGQIKRDALETAIRKTLHQPHKDSTAKDVTSLEVLSAGGEGISDLSGLRDARNLTYLDLSSNRITDITVLSGLTKLTELNLRSNQITDITPLANLINLKELWLYENQITDLTPLGKLKNLSKLYLGLNDISDDQKAMLKKTLPNCDITF